MSMNIDTTFPALNWMEMHDIVKDGRRTGWELFEEAMSDRGIPVNRTNSKSIQAALSIIAESDKYYKGALDGLVAALKEKQKLLDKAIKEYSDRLGEIPMIEKRQAWLTEKLNEKKEELARREAELVKREEVQQDIESKITNNYETKVMRDRMRAAAFFKQEANPQNVYQQTAYINGLAAILAGQKDTAEEGES